MENKENNEQIPASWKIAVLFGLWLQQPSQRKRLAKTEIVELFSEWTNNLNNKYKREN